MGLSDMRLSCRAPGNYGRRLTPMNVKFLFFQPRLICRGHDKLKHIGHHIRQPLGFSGEARRLAFSDELPVRIQKLTRFASFL